MLRKFANRDQLIAYLNKEFPAVAERDNHVSDTVGGRKAAVKALQKVDPAAYAKTRNLLTGAVTRLSPYIRYGVLSLREIRDYVIENVKHPDDATKLINELGWRDYWQRLYVKLGEGIWQDQEEYKTGYKLSNYAPDLPQDIQQGTTGARLHRQF